MKQIKSLKVLSLANGNMTIEIKYKKDIPGVMGRMALAVQLEGILIDVLKKKK